MIFNSLEFAIFLPIVFILYWGVSKKGLKLQNLTIIVFSYIFYGWWDWRFLLLIFTSSLLDFFFSKKIKSRSSIKQKKRFLYLSIFFNLGILGIFKYYNFFTNSLIDSFELLGIHLNFSTLNIILPVGISFYTFQTLSYTIDVYRGKLNPTSDILAFFAFVSFFPQLVAGPIERATNLLPQFLNKREFDYVKAVNGLRQMLWGLFKKIVIADNFGELSNHIFNNSDMYNGYSLVLGATSFAFQIYGDFSGYSDIAIGTSRLFGFNLKRNFAYPYFSRDIAEFWRRWHISLSSWFKDYLYIPLGGSKGGLIKTIRNVFIIFIVSGFWHGPNWTFIIWGLLNAIFFLPLLINNNNRNNLEIVAQGKLLPTLREVQQMITTFLITTFAWVFFRADNTSEAISYSSSMFAGLNDFNSLSVSLSLLNEHIKPPLLILFMFFLVLEWIGRESEFAIEFTFVNRPKLLRYTFYYFLMLTILFFQGSEQEFIYFQF